MANTLRFMTRFNLTRYTKKSIETRQQIRQLNLLECQSKVLLQNYGVNVQKFIIVESPEEATDLNERFKVDEYVIKAQILAGGRGLGVFDNGFKGGVHLTKEADKVKPIVEHMVGHKLVTKQTSAEGSLVRKVMVAESVDITRETYFSIVMDRSQNGPVIVASPAGGVDIEKVAEETPELIGTYPIDINEGLNDATVEKVADFLNFQGAFKKKAREEIKQLYDLFLNVDATQVEINPLAETSDGQVVSVDAKINFDDNAKYRQKAIFELEDKSEMDSQELRAQNNNLNYIKLSGNIGCLVNGAGLAMATMDIIKLHGGEPANFLDVGGGVGESQVLTAFSILTSDVNVRSILVNVFGGIVNCAIVARGIIGATKQLNLNVPLVVRLEGNNVNEARTILKNSGLKIQFANDLDEAARKAVAAI